MPVQIAMALSGIERDQWGDFKELYDCGTNVMSQEFPRRTRSRATNSTSSSRSTSPCSKESGIGSMTANSPIPLTLRDYCLFKLEAMQYGDKNALEVIEIFDSAGKEPVETEIAEAEGPPNPVYSSNLIWTGRNLLDLGVNLIGNATMYQPARLPRGVKSYFENRSQISRLSGAHSPHHKTEKCPFFGCSFEGRRYYE